MMKKGLILLLSLLLLLSFAACAGSKAPDESDTTAPASEPAETATAEAPTDAPAPDAPTAAGKTLVVVFSATGTTKGVAEKIAAIENADLYEIQPAQPYTAADLDWNDQTSRTTKEQNDKSARPAIAGEKLSLDGYTKLYLGYPIWWGEEPRILDTFAESYDFSGITVIPFCTSGGSGIGRSGQNLQEAAGSGNWLNGQRFSGSVSESDLQSWIAGLQ